MGGHKHALVREEPPQYRALPDGFLAENIERCPCQATLFERREEGRLVDQTATRTVHQIGSWFEQAQFPRADKRCGSSPN